MNVPGIVADNLKDRLFPSGGQHAHRIDYRVKILSGVPSPNEENTSTSVCILRSPLYRPPELGFKNRPQCNATDIDAISRNTKTPVGFLCHA